MSRLHRQKRRQRARLERAPDVVDAAREFIARGQSMQAALDAALAPSTAEAQNVKPSRAQRPRRKAVKRTTTKRPNAKRAKSKAKRR